MKKFYLSKGGYTGKYHLDNGGFKKHREVLGDKKEDVFNYLKKNIDTKRKSELHIFWEDFGPEDIQSIEKIFSKSKVKVNLESRTNLD